MAGLVTMKNRIWIAMIALPLSLAACKKAEETTPQNSPANPDQTNDIVEDAAIPEGVDILNAAEIDHPAPDAEDANIDDEPSNPLQGAVIGAAAGGIIGHQSGRALEGAALGGALGAEPDVDEEINAPEEE